ncbi:SPOR domain-containing protein [Sinisalibacter aestuarii]|uniref:Sporulation protein n=1 Tax=Sinisalibacter aestuarii TaxID=2949426 RepID=A0ABQ5LV00_9RHOB|nr:SPOR domain-containing protein [Sinisalibacter aestuarii]GKY88106.1 sporulation protein [Sinisalibacter aestuarii]
MARSIHFRLVLAFGGALALTACEDGQMPAFLQASGSGGGETAANTTTRTVERDVEAPEVFQETDRGLWDGRPSLGGVWVAHADVQDPERVIIRNEDNSKFVVGVIYRPERQTPGPAFQVSSDAADALGMLAGQPATLNVTALRREEVPVGGPPATDGDAPAGALAAAPAVAATSLDDPIEAAAAALDAAEAAPAVSAATPPATRTAASGLEKPFIQIGIFSVKSNAENTAQSLRQAGMVPTVKEGKMSGKNFWRVIVGPATTSADRAALLKKIKELGFTDAYFVTN